MHPPVERDRIDLLGVLANFPRMHILIINCNLNELARAQYEEVCNDLAPAFATVPEQRESAIGRERLPRWHLSMEVVRMDRL